MSQHFLFAAMAGESVLMHGLPPPAFLEYLAEKRLDVPAVIAYPAFTPSARFTPFGWNAHAERLNLRYADPAPHPPLEAVREANSRVFSHALESGHVLESRSRDGGAADISAGDAPGGLFDSLPALESHLRAHPRAAGWVAKGEHGHAGTANRRLSGATLGEDERRDLELLFRQDRWVALEPWHERLLDMSANFHVDAEGGIREFRGHELVNSRDGAFLGVRLAPGGQPPDPWREGLLEAAERLGKALRGIGYFGPVSMDAYARATPAGPVLRPWVDINARLSMALPAHGLARRLPGRHLLWLWAKPRKLSLPGGYDALKAALGPADFDPETRRGILAVSPLEALSAGTASTVSGERSHATGRANATSRELPTGRPKRVAFLLCAPEEADLVTLRTAFQRALGRPA